MPRRGSATDGREEGNILLENAQTMTQKEMVAAGEVAEAQTQGDGGEPINQARSRSTRIATTRDCGAYWRCGRSGRPPGTLGVMSDKGCLVAQQVPGSALG